MNEPDDLVLEPLRAIRGEMGKMADYMQTPSVEMTATHQHLALTSAHISTTDDSVPLLARRGGVRPSFPAPGKVARSAGWGEPSHENPIRRGCAAPPSPVRGRTRAMAEMCADARHLAGVVTLQDHGDIAAIKHRLDRIERRLELTE